MPGIKSALFASVHPKHVPPLLLRTLQAAVTHYFMVIKITVRERKADIMQ